MTNFDSVDALEAAQLVELLDPGLLTVWNGEDAATMLRRQLDAPIVPDIFAAPGIKQLHGAALMDNDLGRRSFANVLTSGETTKELLQAVKEFAQHVQNQPENPLRGGPATVLYYAAIVACLLRHEVCISGLSCDKLREGCAWALTQPGIEPLRDLFEETLQKM